MGASLKRERDLLEFIFSMFDKNGDGIIELWEICELVEVGYR